MALPPLLLLQDIALTFGGTPLVESAELSVSPGERACLVGRNGSGKSTLLKIAAGLIEADRGKRFVQPGATVRYLAQEPDLSAYPTTLAYVEAGLGPGDDHYRARYLPETRSPPTFPAARPAARRLPTCWRLSPTSCCSTNRRTISTCR
jgi:ABC transport system ATP-binding/permease protein